MEHPISDLYLDKRVARASAVLGLASAWDVATELQCADFHAATLYFAYTRGGATGAVNFRIDVSPDSTGTTWYQMSQYAPGALVAGADTTSNLQRENITYTAIGATIEHFVYGPIDLEGTVERIRIPARETGAALTPGILEIEVIFS